MTRKEELKHEMDVLRDKLKTLRVELNGIETIEERQRKKSELETLAENNDKVIFTCKLGEDSYLYAGQLSLYIDIIQFNGLWVRYTNVYDEDNDLIYHFDNLEYMDAPNLNTSLDVLEVTEFEIIPKSSLIVSHLNYYLYGFIKMI